MAAARGSWRKISPHTMNGIGPTTMSEDAHILFY